MNLRLSVLLVSVLLIFGGTVLVVSFTGSDDSEPENPWLYRIDEDAIQHISVRYQGQTTDYKKGTGSLDWYIQGDTDVPVVKEKWGGVTLLLSGPRVSRQLADEIDNPASYGLEPPATRVVVTDRRGKDIEFHLGAPTPDGENYYARLVGGDGLFLVPSSWAEVISRLATDPPYPPEDSEGTPLPG